MGYRYTLEGYNEGTPTLTIGELPIEALRSIYSTVKAYAATRTQYINYYYSQSDEEAYGGAKNSTLYNAGVAHFYLCNPNKLSNASIRVRYFDIQEATAIYGSNVINSEARGAIETVQMIFGLVVAGIANYVTWGKNLWEEIPEMGVSDATYTYQNVGPTVMQTNNGPRLICSPAGAKIQQSVAVSAGELLLYDNQLGISQNAKQFAEINRLYSGLLFVNDEGDTPEQTLQKAKTAGRYVTYITSKAGTQGGGVQGNAIYMQWGFNRYYQTQGSILLQYIDNSKVTSEEVFEDTDNTYPGGGEDKNTYPEDGESGKGTFDNTNDEVDFPPIPLWDATSTGFISMWNPTITEITSLYGFLWDSDISTTLKKLFLEPMDAIISLAFFPVDPVNFPDKRNVTIGHVDTEIEMYAVQKQFVDFDFGELVIDEYYGAAWDYSPYTQASIYLPYIGTQALDIDDVMNGTLHLKYRVDLLSGMCAAMLRVDRSRDGLQAVIYTWQGNCAMQVPITAGSAREFLNSIIQLGAMAGISLAQPLAGAIDASMHKGDENYESSVMGNNWINPTIATFSALNVIGQKVRVQRGGRVDANAGVMSPQEAYIILNRPVSAIPKGWNEYAGYPSLKIKTLSTQKGYTEVAYIKLNGLEATSDEIMELDGMLKGGVIL